MTSRFHLPAPDDTGGLSGVLMARRSVRDYAGEGPAIAELARLLWSGQGVSHSSGKRTAPSPHALYPLSLYVVAGRVPELEAGLYLYEPRAHVLDVLGHGDLREELYRAALDDQPWIRDCPAVIVIAGDAARAEAAFADQPPDGKRGRRYLYMEAGAVAQNIALQAAELDLGTVLVGGFEDDRVRQCLGIDPAPLILLPVGRSAE